MGRMSAHCCGSNATFDGLSADYRRRLWAVIAINATMFLVEMAAGALAGSQALQADALDFAADAATYGISLAVIGALVASHTGRLRFIGTDLASVVDHHTGNLAARLGKPAGSRRSR